ncbi:TetR/AcrR family transcriptional regulator [Hymenobacter sp.]|jgi:AcrR family transcriptional regulator|uniref:TetR/AcrR family transcriptional regulator n=1 Tax=Hymenobacter sp. TaxID=1898978 RepID=UPI002ED810AF
MSRTTLSIPTSPQTKEDAIRESVMQAAQRLFQQHGLAKVTLEDVAKAIGKGKSTLYYYYKSKEEIFTAVMDREIGEVMDEMTKEVEKATTAEEKLSTFSLTKLRALRKKLALYGIVCKEIINQAEFSHSMRQRYLQRENTLLKDILDYGIETGELGKLSPKDVDSLVFVMLSGLHGMEQEMILNNNFEMMEPAVNILTRSLIHGLRH